MALVVFTYGIAVAQQPDSKTKTGREADVYKIYSILLTNPSTSHGPDNNVRYLIDETTKTIGWQEPCVDPPKERKGEFAEVLAEFKTRKSTPRKLKRQFTIAKPYELMAEEQVKAFIEERSMLNPGPVQPDPKYHGVTDLFTLSDVWFSRDGRLALTAISTWCNSLCGQHQWKVFEKLASGEWQERNWITCFTIAQQGHASSSGWERAQ